MAPFFCATFLLTQTFAYELNELDKSFRAMLAEYLYYCIVLHLRIHKI